MTKKLEGKVAVVTGATSGLALASAKQFAEEGAYVFITGRGQAQLVQAVRDIGRNVTGIQGDAANLAHLDRLYEMVRAEKGHIDILFASAGFGEPNVPLAAVTEENFDALFNLNVRGTLFAVQKALPLLRDGGSIIMTGSIGGLKGLPGLSVYCASKAALRSFARTWAVELAARKIRVNVLSPGIIASTAYDQTPIEIRERFRAMTPMGRPGRPQEIAGAALFLASDDSSFVTGIELCVDGGIAQV